MTILYFALFLIAVGLVLWLLNKLVVKLAYDRSARYLHCRIIPVVFLTVVLVANVYTSSELLTFLDKIVNSPLLARIFDLILPNRAYELVYMLLIIIGLNIAIIPLVALVICATQLILSRWERFVDIRDYDGFDKVLHLPWLLAAFFYTEEDGEVHLNHRGFTLGLWAKWMKYAFTVLLAGELILLGASILWGTKEWNSTVLTLSKSWYMIPMAGFLIMEQIQFFLEGDDDHGTGTFGSAEITETLRGDISALQDAYGTIFSGSDALLYSEMTGSHLNREGLGSNDLGNRQIQDCRQPEVLTVIANQLQQCGVHQNEQYQNALVELLNGHNINLCNHCEGEFFIFLAAYLNFHISQGKTALILCKDPHRAKELRNAMDHQMHRINSLYSVWDVRTLEEAEVNCRLSILVCSFDEFLDRRICEKRRDFIGDLFCTVIMDGFDLFSRNSIRVERLFGALRGIDGMDQYVVFTDVDNDALRTAMEQVIKAEILPFNHDVMGPNTGIMIWREESYYKLQRQLGIGGALSPYMGAALPLALVAAKYDLPQMYLLTDSSRGDHSYRDAMTMSSKEVNHFLGKTINLKSVIRQELPDSANPDDLAMIVAYDTDYNFYNALWRWMKYGGTDGSLIHILSPSYLLREYFVANFREKAMLLKNNEFDAFISYHLGMRISHMAVLLVSLCENAMTEEELMAKSKEFGWEFENVEQLLTECLRVVLTREEIHSIFECFHFEEAKTFRDDLGIFENHTYVTLTDDTIRRRLQERIGHVSLVSKSDVRLSLPILRGNVHNYYQRDQIVPIDGHLYQITAINNGNIYAEQILPQDVPEYHQISQFTFRDYKQVDECVDSGFINFNICTASVTRENFGYWSCNRGNRFAANCDVQLHNMRSADGHGQLTTTDCANILELNLRRSALGGRDVETARLLAYMLKELFKTLFPATHQNLYTVVSEGIDEGLLDRVLSDGEDRPSLEDLVCSLIPRLTAAPTGDPDLLPTVGTDFITVYVVELSCIEYGMVQMLYQKRQTLLLMIREYLDWYIASNADAIPAAPAADKEEGDLAMPVEESTRVRGRYLHFGSDSVPAIFAPEELLRLCRRYLPEVERAPEAAEGPRDAATRTCTFCGRPTLFPTELSDGRCMCSHCKDHQLTQKDEIKSMFLETVLYLTEGYDITLPRKIHVRFQSADAIARATGGVDGGRILGFYNSGNHQLWLEARGPRIAMQSTLIHELTHAWQHHDRAFVQAFQRMLRKFPRNKRALVRLLLLEGHSVYMEIDAMRRMHEDEFADRMHAMSMAREDEYGHGYRLVSGYIGDLMAAGSHMTPYKAMTQLVLDIAEGRVTLE